MWPPWKWLILYFHLSLANINNYPGSRKECSTQSVQEALKDCEIIFHGIATEVLDTKSTECCIFLGIGMCLQHKFAQIDCSESLIYQPYKHRFRDPLGDCSDHNAVCQTIPLFKHLLRKIQFDSRLERHDLQLLSVHHGNSSHSTSRYSPGLDSNEDIYNIKHSGSRQTGARSWIFEDGSIGVDRRIYSQSEKNEEGNGFQDNSTKEIGNETKRYNPPVNDSKLELPSSSAAVESTRVTNKTEIKSFHQNGFNVEADCSGNNTNCFRNSRTLELDLLADNVGRTVRQYSGNKKYPPDMVLTNDEETSDANNNNNIEWELILPVLDFTRLMNEHCSQSARDDLNSILRRILAALCSRINGCANDRKPRQSELMNWFSSFMAPTMNTTSDEKTRSGHFSNNTGNPSLLPNNFLSGVLRNFSSFAPSTNVSGISETSTVSELDQFTKVLRNSTGEVEIVFNAAARLDGLISKLLSSILFLFFFF